MVMIKFLNKDSTKISIRREFLDHKEQLIIFSSFSVIIIILMVFSYVSTQLIPRFYFTYLAIFLLILLYYLCPTSMLILDLEINRWDIKKMVYFIPFSHKIGKISDISKFISYELVDYRKSNPKSKLSFRRKKYISAFQLWGFQGSDEEREKFIIFTRTTYNFSSHEKEMSENNRIGLSLGKYFETLKIPIDYALIRDAER